MKVGSLSLFDLKKVCIHYRSLGSCSDCPLYIWCRDNMHDFINSNYILHYDVDKRFLVDNSTIISICDFDCDVRIKNALLRSGFNSFNEVALLTKSELKKIRSIGNIGYNYLVNLLENLFVDYKINEVKK